MLTLDHWNHSVGVFFFVFYFWTEKGSTFCCWMPDKATLSGREMPVNEANTKGYGDNGDVLASCCAHSELLSHTWRASENTTLSHDNVATLRWVRLKRNVLPMLRTNVWDELCSSTWPSPSSSPNRLKTSNRSVVSPSQSTLISSSASPSSSYICENSNLIGWEESHFWKFSLSVSIPPQWTQHQEIQGFC